MSLIKTPSQILSMRKGGKILADILKELSTLITPGLEVTKLEDRFLELCKQYGVEPSCKGYTADNMLPPFPTGLCVSVNNQSVHCFPKKGIKLKDGDLVTVDTVVKYEGMHVDASFAKGVGEISETTAKLLKGCKEALELTTKKVKAGVKIGSLAQTMHSCVRSHGFDVLRDYAGHGIGELMHEPPEVPCYGNENDGMLLLPGMTICIEALVCEGKPEVEEVSEWETKMRDGLRFLQFEYTVLVTPSGHEVLTPVRV